MGQIEWTDNGSADAIFEVEWERELGPLEETGHCIRKTLREYKIHGYPELGMLFNVWQFSIPELYGIILTIFHDLDLFSVLRVSYQNLLRFVVDVDKSYFAENPYHSFKHAMDVCCQTYYMLTDLQAGVSLTRLDQASLLIAALCHDTGHPGKNNLYQVKAQSHLAKLYGDVSTLESHSCSIAASLMEKHGILKDLESESEKEYVRNYVKETIMATDMVFHGPICADFDALFCQPISSPMEDVQEEVDESGGDLPEKKGDKSDRQEQEAMKQLSEIYQSQLEHKKKGLDVAPPSPTVELLCVTAGARILVGRVVLHAADISNACRPWDLCKKWSDPVVEEFFAQGDAERDLNLSISPNMDRNVATQYGISLGFNEYIVKPLFLQMQIVWPHFSVYLEQLNSNKRKWERLRDGLPPGELEEPVPVEQLTVKHVANAKTSPHPSKPASKERRESTKSQSDISDPFTKRTSLTPLDSVLSSPAIIDASPTAAPSHPAVLALAAPLIGVGRRMSMIPGILPGGNNNLEGSVFNAKIRSSMADVTRYAGRKPSTPSISSSKHGTQEFLQSASITGSRENLSLLGTGLNVVNGGSSPGGQSGTPTRISGIDYKNELENTLNFLPTNSSGSREAIISGGGMFHALNRSPGRRGSTPLILSRNISSSRQNPGDIR